MLKRLSIKEYWFLFQLKNKKKKNSENLDHHGTHILQN